MFTTQNSLRHTLLIAMPQLQDQNFVNSVIYICEHNQQGAMGLIINRPMDVPLYKMFQKSGITYQEPASSSELSKVPLYFGGPVEVEYGFVLHTCTESHSRERSIMATNNIALSSSHELLATIASGQEPEKYLVTLGYTGWGPGQLEREMATNTWLNCPATLPLIFDTPRDQLLNRACEVIGITYALLSLETGHA